MIRAILEVSGAIFWLNVWGVLWMFCFWHARDWWGRRMAVRAFLKSVGQEAAARERARD